MMVEPRHPGNASPIAPRGMVARWASLLTTLSLLLTLALPVGLAMAQDNDGSGDNDAAEATPQGDGSSPVGQYTVAITEDDVPQDLASGADLLGRWQLSFDDDGTYTVVRADIGLVVTGSYVVDGETIIVTDEDGLLSCVNAIPAAGPDQPVETAIYSWELASDGLTLTPIAEGCTPRSILLSTRTLGPFVACTTTAVVLNAGDATDPSESADATPNATPAAEAEATSELDEDEIPVIDNPFGDDDDEDADTQGEDDSEDSSDVTDEDAELGIDNLLRQLSACWGTQDPARIIPLFGADFLDALLEEAGSLQDVAGIFGQIMVVPINWERSGPVEADAGVYSAIIALTIGGEETFQRYSFVFEDGQWLLDSFGF